jgi:thiamine pyrophosphokinase
VKTTGLEWNLDDEIGFSSRGLSNKTNEDEFTVNATGSVFVLIHNS